MNWKRIKTSKSVESEENVLQMPDCELKETTSRTEQYSSSSQEIVVETVLGTQENVIKYQTQIIMKTEGRENDISNERGIDDEELDETLPVNKKISLLGEHYSESDLVTSERSETAEGEENVGIHPDIVKNVDGPARQRKGRSRPSRKEMSSSGSPVGETEDFSQHQGRPRPSVQEEEEEEEEVVY